MPKSLYVWTEENHRTKNISVRSRTPEGVNTTHYTIQKNQTMVIDTPEGKRTYSGKWLARKLKEQIEQNPLRQVIGESKQPTELPGLIERFLDNVVDNDLSHRTWGHYRTSLRRMMELEFMPPIKSKLETIFDITPDHIRAMSTLFKAHGYQNKTRRGMLSDVRRFLSWCQSEKILKESPFPKGTLPKEKRKEPRYWTTDEWLKFDQAIAKLDHPDAPAARIAFNLAHNAGLRLCEAAGHGPINGVEEPGVLWEDITWTDEGADLLLRAEVVKGGARSRVVPLDDITLQVLGSRGSGPLVKAKRRTIQMLFMRARGKAEIKAACKIHGLRHSFAKNYLQDSPGANLGSLQDLLGHAYAETTRIYASFEKGYFRRTIAEACEKRKIRFALAGNRQGKIQEIHAAVVSEENQDVPIKDVQSV